MTFIDILSFSMLILACIDDLRSKKIHNKLLLFLLPIAIITIVIIKGPLFLLYIALPSCLLALALTLPLYFSGFIGGGDVKLCFVIAITWSSRETLWAFIFSLFIGALLGVVRTIFQGNILSLLENIKLLIKFQKPEKEKLQTFPYSVVLLLGWMSFRVLEGRFFI